jgi:hypothetical protein
MTTELWNVVFSWKYPKEEMVAYRSFKPFFPLLDVHQVLICCTVYSYTA